MYDKLSPFIAAFFASWLTYIFTVRSGRRELAYQRRLEAFEKIYGKLTDLYHYIEDRCNEINGFKRGWFPEGSPEARKPLRAHIAEFKQMVDTYEVYLPRDDYGFEHVIIFGSAEVEETVQATDALDNDAKQQKLKDFWNLSRCVRESQKQLVASLRLPHR